MSYRIIHLLPLLFIIACQPTFDEPVISLDQYQIEDGFELKVIASEPFLEAPVVIDFDSKGRIWTVEMRGYMRDVDGSTEDQPTGVISILEDQDKDGVMDHSKIFMDHLVMPRALALVYGGLLYVESPNLWFVEIENDKPGKKVLVDSVYAVGGNPEHQPNGLMLGIDNWIYNAKSNSRYQKKNGKWMKEVAAMKGQWGITKDDFGRLYYNDNSTQLKGDYVLPNLLIRNRYFKPKNGINKTLTTNQKVYPLIVNPVNRGYIPGVLDEDSLLARFTSACGPLVYRGGQFPQAYDQNAFVCAPEANLVKRNILSISDYYVSAKQAWDDKEFLVASDDAFRPVNLFNGPDGAMYIVDMHRGVIQHNAFLSPYLKEHIKRMQSDTILGMGRILKVQHQNQELNPIPDFDNLSAQELVKLLQHKNGWVRDRAQHYLIYKNQQEAVSELEKMLLDNSKPLSQIHAMYALKGIEKLTFENLIDAAKNSNQEVCAHVLVLLEGYAENDRVEKMNQLTKELLAKKNPTIDLYLSFTLGSWANVSRNETFRLLSDLSTKYADEPLFQEAIISGLGENEEAYLEFVKSRNISQGDYFSEQLAQTIENKKNKKVNSIFSPFTHHDDARTKGMRFYKAICSACHGIDGLGIDGLAPPLMESEYVTGSVERLGLIVLHGLYGPVHVNGELYELNGVMPGLINNKTLTDSDIADIISFVTNSFSRNPRGINPDQVGKLRMKKPLKAAGYTEEELVEME
ncbi:c-type cytochrome [Reichenbachiella sp. MALMAid0571]|uniref:DUF7133 domain-containing protein n=1 Tax=Reichenbachiella sp. MALMAid0571 TaxID=3143939 RepID=UPI0032DECD1B